VATMGLTSELVCAFLEFADRPILVGAEGLRIRFAYFPGTGNMRF